MEMGPEAVDTPARVTVPLVCSEMEPVPVDATTYFPDWLSGLNGQTIRLRGWMYPPAKSEGISRFLFVRDSGLCCFGAKPRIYDKVAVRLKEGESTRHIVGRPFDVVGTLVIEPVVEDENELFFGLPESERASLQAQLADA